jgi:hypothetical protein
MVKFTKCLREHGIDAETKGGPGGKNFGIHITGRPGQGKPGPGGPPPQFLAARRACQRYAPAGPFENLSPAQKAEAKQKALEFARCMRSHGVQVPDPGSSGVLEMTNNNINPESATFQRAQQTCQHLMGKAPIAIRARFAPGGPGPKSESGSVQAPAPAGGGEK